MADSTYRYLVGMESAEIGVQDGGLVFTTGSVPRAHINSDGTVSGLLSGSPAVIDAVLEYGIKADGASDDTSRWQALFADAEAEQYGAEIILPVGVTRTSAPLQYTADNVRFRGRGQGNPKGAVWANRATSPVYGGCVFQPLPSFVGDYVIKWWQGSSPVRSLSGIFLEHFSIDGFYLPVNVGGIYYSSYNGGMESVTVARVTGDGFVVEGAGSTGFPQDAYDLRLNNMKADSCSGNGITFNALDSSDNVLSEFKATNNTGFGINNNSSGLQVLGGHIYSQSGSAMYSVTRSLVVDGLRLSDIGQHGLVLVDDVAHSGAFTINIEAARDVGKSADNTYDIVNYSPSATTRGGKISVSMLTTQANRPRYAVNPGANAADLVIDKVEQSYISPASSALGTGAVPVGLTNGIDLRWRDKRATAQGLVAQHFDRASTDGTVALTGGVAYAMLVDLAEGDVISNVYVGCSSAGSGVTLFKAGIYSADGATRYAVTNDQSALFGSTGIKTLPLTAAWQVPKTGSYYVVLVSTASTTLPALLKGIQGTVLAASAVGSGVQPFGTHGTTGLTDLPATLSNSTVATTAYWVGVGPS